MLGSILLLLGSLPAGAVVVRGGGSREEVEEAERLSHAAGMALPSVVAVTVTSRDGRGRCQGSGVYLGSGGGELNGHILTCAHLFCGEPVDARAGLGEVLVTFAGGGKRARADRVFLAPMFKSYPKWFSLARALDVEPVRADLAIVEFCMAGWTEAARAALTPARLHAGTPGPDGVLLEAQIAGCGVFGTSRGPAPVPGQPRLHAGKAWVAYGTWRERTAFLLALPSTPHWDQSCPPARPRDRAELPGPWPGPAGMGFRDDTSGAIYPVCCHPEQAVTAPGDSGGPLFLLTLDGPRVAGIASSTLDEHLTHGPNGAMVSTLLQFFEPVTGQLEWIRATRDGTAAVKRVVEVTGVVSPAPAEEMIELCALG